MRIFSAYFLLLNVVGFLLMGFDKLQAVQSKRRVPERWFFLISLVGGAFGVIAGMFIFHHKTSKASFQLLIILALIIFLTIVAVLNR
ncbi:MAG: DUF1294 domain-containing protein [Thermoproteota archaeon]